VPAHALDPQNVAIASLPVELLDLVIWELDDVSKIYFGLSCRKIIQVYHSWLQWREIHGPDLALQTSVCGKYVLNSG
jgi:hypothetical protein